MKRGDAKELERTKNSNSDPRTEDEESLAFLRGRETDYLFSDDPEDPDAIPLENLYSAAGRG